MRSNVIEQTSYERTISNLLEYDKKNIDEICRNLKFPKLVSSRFVALRKNVEIGFLANNLTKWEYQNVYKYGQNHIYQEYYPAIYDLVKNTGVARKIQNYGFVGNYYFHLFPPTFYEKMIYNFYIILFERPIFKQFHAMQGQLEQKIMNQISTYFRKQNKYGPEKINVAILDEQFICVAISGLLTPFLKDLIRRKEDALFIERLFIEEGKDILKQILISYYAGQQQEPFIHFDKYEDKLIIISSLSSLIWEEFLEKMSTLD